METMFCPNCGADNQSVESYCRSCGKWLPDIDALTNRKLFGKLTREQKIEKIRILEAISAGLSLTSTAIIISILAGGDVKMLFLAAFCCIVVAIYQVINFYLGYKLQQKTIQNRAENIDETEQIAGKRVNTLNAADTTQFINQQSIIENTTELLEPEHIPRRSERNK